MIDSNQFKSINGYTNKLTLLQQLKQLQKNCVITECRQEYRNGYENFDKSQFFAPYYIEFYDGVGWLLYPSTSIRNDRMNNQQWNSYHLKQIKPTILKAFLVMPNDLIQNDKELKMAKSYNEKIYGSRVFSAIDGVLTQDQLVQAILSYGQKVQQSLKYTPDRKASDAEEFVYGVNISGNKIKL